MAEELKVGSLAKALSAARDKCKPAEKDAENKFDDYMYASAEAIISAANDALQKSDLVLIPVIEEMRTVAPGNTVVDRTWLLCHSSGEQLTIKLIAWPVVPIGRKPLDKALASALTSSTAYRLRDLLQIPRVDPSDDISGRDDNDHGSNNGQQNGHAPNTNGSVNGVQKDAPKPAQPAQKPANPTLDNQYATAVNGIKSAKDAGNLDAWVKWAQQFSFTEAQKASLKEAHETRSASLNPANNF